MKGRIFALGVLLALCALLLCSCGRGAKSEKEIMADILEKRIMDELAMPYVEKENISSMEILKRQTNKELKNDFVYVTVQADLGTARFIRSIKLTYNYYDDKGWLLDEYEIYPDGENRTLPLTEPGEHEVMCFFNHLSNVYHEDWDFVKYTSWSVENVTTDFENGEATMEVIASRETEAIKTTEYLTMTAHFMPNSCIWEIDGDSVGPYLQKLTYELKVKTGDYFCESPAAHLVIYEFNSQNNSITAEMDIENRNNSGTFVLNRVNTEENPGLDLDHIQETVTDNEKLNSLFFLRFSADIGKYESKSYYGEIITHTDTVVLEPGYQTSSPFSYSDASVKYSVRKTFEYVS